VADKITCTDKGGLSHQSVDGNLHPLLEQTVQQHPLEAGSSMIEQICHQRETSQCQLKQPAR
jgi:hypothetical protein